MHAPAAIEALEAGKHVLVEKPIALHGEQADRIIECARANGRTLMTAQVLRFFADYIPLINLNTSGELGSVRSALFRRRCAAPTWGDWLPDPAKSGGGVFDLLIHDIDMALHLFGNPESVSATGHEDLGRGIDVIDGRMHYSDGHAVAIAGGWHHPSSYPFSMEYTVTYDGGTVDYRSDGRPPKLHRADGSETELPRPEKDGYQAEIEYFVECVTAGKAPERCPPEESAAAVKLAHLLAGARSGIGERVKCEL
jgi:predicted dehydrogenase